MRTGTRTWKRFVAQVIVELDKLDPYRLEPGDPDRAPADEHEPEASSIARQLLSDGRISLADVDAIWLHQFGESLTSVMNSEDADDLVARLNGLLDS